VGTQRLKVAPKSVQFARITVVVKARSSATIRKL
jgi:hypothetical protein